MAKQKTANKSEKMGRPPLPPGEKKRPVGIKLSDEQVAQLEACSLATGLKKNTIIEQGLIARLAELSKAQNNGKPWA
jgi:hypothetical protein